MLTLPCLIRKGFKVLASCFRPFNQQREVLAVERNNFSASSSLSFGAAFTSTIPPTPTSLLPPSYPKRPSPQTHHPSMYSQASMKSQAMATSSLIESRRPEAKTIIHTSDKDKIHRRHRPVIGAAQM
jgi:hypothetical protein